MRQIYRQHRWLFDHAVKGMRRVMGKFGTSVALETVTRRQPVGISWQKVVTATGDRQIDTHMLCSQWMETRKLDPADFGVREEEGRVQLIALSLRSLSGRR